MFLSVVSKHIEAVGFCREKQFTVLERIPALLRGGAHVVCY